MHNNSLVFKNGIILTHVKSFLVATEAWKEFP